MTLSFNSQSQNNWCACLFYELFYDIISWLLLLTMTLNNNTRQVIRIVDQFTLNVQQRFILFQTFCLLIWDESHCQLIFIYVLSDIECLDLWLYRSGGFKWWLYLAVDLYAGEKLSLGLATCCWVEDYDYKRALVFLFVMGKVDDGFRFWCVEAKFILY